MRGSTFLLEPSSFDRRKARKILIFFLSLSSSPSFLVCFSFPPPVSLPSFPYPTQFPLSTCLFLSHFSISFSFPLFFSFSLFFFFLFFFSFLFSFYLILIHPPNLSKSGETSSPLSSMPHVITMFFFLIFFILFFPFIISCNTWLNVSHLFQVYHMALAMRHSLEVPYGIHMIMPCVTRHPVSLEKRKISTVSKSDGVTRFRETNSTVESVSSSEI